MHKIGLAAEAPSKASSVDPALGSAWPSSSLRQHSQAIDELTKSLRQTPNPTTSQMFQLQLRTERLGLFVLGDLQGLLASGLIYFSEASVALIEI